MTEAAQALGRLLSLMARLRDPQLGCPWDREQTFESIAPYTIEEAYEVADAIERGDARQLCDELGDLLFQVVFHTRLAEERGWFDFAAVAGAIHDKLVRRHPHVFAGAALAPSDLARAWEEQKAAERAAAAAHDPQEAAHERSGVAPGAAGTLTGVPLGLPALTRAAKLGRRAARVGFDWADADAVRAKVLEELRELDGALAAARGPQDPQRRGDAPEGGLQAVTEELGDLLFTVVNLSRHLGCDAEHSLRAANRKFERRFARMEALARARSQELTLLSAAQWDALWKEAKLNGG